MLNSIFLAKAFAIYFIIISLALILNKSLFMELIDQFKSNTVSKMMAAILTLLLGSFLVAGHNIWRSEWWVVLITVLCWITLIRGALYLFYPSFVEKVANSLQSKTVYYTISIVFLVIGLILGYYGCYYTHMENGVIESGFFF